MKRRNKKEKAGGDGIMRCGYQWQKLWIRIIEIMAAL
jgi:hypothetical protein